MSLKRSKVYKDDEGREYLVVDRDHEDNEYRVYITRLTTTTTEEE